MSHGGRSLVEPPRRHGSPIVASVFAKRFFRADIRLTRRRRCTYVNRASVHGPDGGGGGRARFASTSSWRGGTVEWSALPLSFAGEYRVAQRRAIQRSRARAKRTGVRRDNRLGKNLPATPRRKGFFFYRFSWRIRVIPQIDSPVSVECRTKDAARRNRVLVNFSRNRANVIDTARSSK